LRGLASRHRSARISCDYRVLQSRSESRRDLFCVSSDESQLIQQGPLFPRLKLDGL